MQPKDKPAETAGSSATSTGGPGCTSQYTADPLPATRPNFRRAKVIHPGHIRDDGVAVMATRSFADMDAFHEHVRRLANRYRRDVLADQRVHVEVWCEASGMQPQLAEVANAYTVSVYSCGGFDSFTAKYDLAQRIVRVAKPAIILHLGDFDPSGEAMFRAVFEDVRALVIADRRDARVDVEFRRVALTEEQVGQYQLPTAPAKREKNSHATNWGDRETCQLEALPPDVISALLNTAIQEALDMDRVQDSWKLKSDERFELTRLLPAPGGSR